MSKRKWALHTSILVGFALSGLFLWLALRQVNLVELTRVFTEINLVPVLLSAVAVAGSMALRAMRWRLITGLPRGRHRQFARATYLGVLVNLLLPGRVGEAVRVVTLARISGSSLTLPLASAVIDRLVDVTVLIICAGGLFLTLPVDRVLSGWLTNLLAGGLVIAAGLTFFLKGAEFWEQRLKALTARWLERWSLRPDVFLCELRHEFHELMGGWMTLEVAAVAMAILGCDYLTVAALFTALAIPLSPTAPLLVFVCLAAGSALPSAPGYVGVYQAAAVVALAFYSQTAESAVALATVLQLVTLAVALLMNGRGALGLTRLVRIAVAGQGKSR